MSVDKALAPVIECRPQSTGVVRINATLGPVVTRSIARSASTNVAVDLYRVLAELNREAYLPHLATSMNNLANRLAEADRYERAPSWLAKLRRTTTTWLEQTRTCSDRRLSIPTVS